MERNIVLSLPQVTVDFTFRLPDQVERVCAQFVRRERFPEKRDELEHIASFGLRTDHNIRLDLNAKSAIDIGGALEYLRATYPGIELSQIGGNPAIAAVRGHFLGNGNRDVSLPIVRYAGIYPASLDEFIARQEQLAPKFYCHLKQIFDKDICSKIDDRPMTLALEDQHKLIIAYTPGRTIDSISSIGDFSAYLRKLEPLLPADQSRKMLLAFASVPYPLELGRKLLDQVNTFFGDRALIFIGCSSFRSGSTLNVERTKEIWDHILKRAHILSMNDTELGDLHTVVVGNGMHQEKALAYKLLELPTDAIKVCHGAAGALMDPGADPGRIINAEQFMASPFAFLEETLRLATDGATYGMASLSGHDATEAGVRVFSASVASRNTEKFKSDYLNVLESMPPGVISAYTPVVWRPLHALTGVGARFDGLLTTLLMRA
jgi:hypothetical protein